MFLQWWIEIIIRKIRLLIDRINLGVLIIKEIALILEK